ncbi:MAG: hypothetical protein EWV57_19195, partial [Microcystis aeruginosa Ma_QC_Ch_20071001_S25D]
SIPRNSILLTKGMVLSSSNCLILLSKLDCNSGDKVIILSMISNSLIICSLSNSFSYNPLINFHFHCSRCGSFPVVAFVFRCAMTIIAKGLLLVSN